jgi:hypothetical protein|tara:strand:+ start:1262 stop:1456 length:195 start_codon:yes stop_codon:yes gene_type:complete
MKNKSKRKMHKTSDPTWHTMTYGLGESPFDIDYIVHYNKMLGTNQIIFVYKNKDDGKIVKYKIN